MRDYIAVVHLVKRPPATRAQWLFVADIAYSLGQSIVGSADDAREIVTGALPGSTVYVWEPDWWGGSQAIHDYLGAPCVDRAFTPPLVWKCPNCLHDITLRDIQPLPEATP